MKKAIGDMELVENIRKFFRLRDDHHARCNSRRGDECDCYASNSTKAHELLDEVSRRLEARGGR